MNVRRAGGDVMVLEKETGYVNAQEAARMLGVNKRAVRSLVTRRRLESKRDGGGTAARLLVS
jgi:DNA-directed RNA polymerase specialized sigma24 family protein